MIQTVKKCVGRALIVPLALGLFSGIAMSQEREDATEDIRNVQLVFHLVQADGFADEDPEISDVVTELRTLFSFRGYRLLSTSMLNVGLLPVSAATVSGSGSQRIVPGDSAAPLEISAEITARRATATIRARVTLTEGTSRLRGGGEAMAIISEPSPLLEASVTIRDGQRVVLGSARRTAGEPVLILIVTPRIDP